MPAMSLLFWDQSASAALFPPGKVAPQVQPGPFPNYLQPSWGRCSEAGKAAGERRGGPTAKPSCQDLAALRSSGPGSLRAQQVRVPRASRPVPRKRLNLAHPPALLSLPRQVLR